MQHQQNRQVEAHIAQMCGKLRYAGARCNATGAAKTTSSRRLYSTPRLGICHMARATPGFVALLVAHSRRKRGDRAGRSAGRTAALASSAERGSACPHGSGKKCQRRIRFPGGGSHPPADASSSLQGQVSRGLHSKGMCPRRSEKKNCVHSTQASSGAARASGTNRPHRQGGRANRHFSRPRGRAARLCNCCTRPRGRVGARVLKDAYAASRTRTPSCGPEGRVMSE